MTTRRASCDDALRRFGMLDDHAVVVGHDGATIALGASGLRRSPRDSVNCSGALLAAPAGAVACGSLDRLHAVATVAGLGSAVAGTAASAGIGGVERAGVLGLLGRRGVLRGPW